ncbi:bifunctional aspartate kinase II/homoserine dehydrogenase II domain protein, partial [Vibrio parahaemolyticus V-223/04]
TVDSQPVIPSAKARSGSVMWQRQYRF